MTSTTNRTIFAEGTLPLGGKEAPPADEDIGKSLHDFVARLFPIHRAITGVGVRQTLKILQQEIPLEIHEVPTGTQVFDWQVPQEWNIQDAYIKDDQGNRVVDFRTNNLHIVNYSRRMNERMSWNNLKKHLHTLPEHPDWIPYRTVHFRDTWGFCLSHHQFQQLESMGNREYEVCIDATFSDGFLTYGECVLPGELADEVLLVCHCCHPSLANDNTAAIAIATRLAKRLANQKRRYTYRFVFHPATIGAITWLSINEKQLSRIKHGLVLALLGDSAPSTYKKSRHEDAEIDRIVQHVLQHSQAEYNILPYAPDGYDERQYGSPGINLPVGCLMRSPNNCFPEYHSSADNLDLVTPEALQDSWLKCVQVVQALEANHRYRNLKPMGEPRLGPSGLYHGFGEQADHQQLDKAVSWVLSFSDTRHTLLDIAERSEIEFSLLAQAAELLLAYGFIERCTSSADNESTFPAKQ